MTASERSRDRGAEVAAARSVLSRLVPGEARHLARGTWSLRAVRSARIELPADVSAARIARQAVDLHLGHGLTEREGADMRLLVTELVTNTVRHGGGGGVLYLAASDRVVRGEVCDDGPWRTLPTNRTPAAGVGMMLVDRLASRWGVSGDNGTCVWFELDRAAAAARPQRVRVLVVDDDPAIRALYAVWLERDTVAQVSGTATLAEAYAHIAAERPDIVLLDQRLPDGEGLDGARTLLAQDASIDVILVTGDDDPDLERMAEEVGISDFVLKGELSARVLVRCIRWTVRRREDRRALQHSEQQVQTLFASVSVGLFRTDAAGACVYVNNQWCTLTGLSAELSVGHLWSQTVHPEDADRIGAAWQQAAADVTQFAGEHRLCTPTGDVRWVEAQATPQRSKGGELTGFFGFAVDITERRMAEQRLAESAQRHRQVLRHLPDAMVTLYDRELHCVLIEGAYLDELGVTDTSQFVGAHIGTIGPADEVKALLEPMRRALTGETTTVSYHAQREDRHLIIDVLPYRDTEGEIVGVLNVSHDVSAQRSIDDRRHRAEERFRVAFEQAPIGIAIVGLDGRFTEVNNALCDILAMTADRIQSLEPFTIVHSEDLEHVRRTFAALSPERPDLSIEHRVITGAGNVVWANATVTLIFDEKGTPLHALAQVQDITERRHQQDELQHLADHDPLTGLYNRRRYDRALTEHLALVRRYGSHGALITLDLDGFKTFNDTLGHPAGDALLNGCAATLRERLRATDLVARTGGDEFAILIPEGGRTEAERVAAAIIATIRESCGHWDLPVTVSAGVATFEAGPDLSAASILADVDEALYAAKRAGKNRYVVHPGADHDPA